MGKYTKIMRIRMTPEQHETVEQVSKEIGRKPSTTIRLCVEAMLRPSEMAQMTAEMLRKAAESRGQR